jgi:hypothetical protein
MGEKYKLRDHRRDRRAVSDISALSPRHGEIGTWLDVCRGPHVPHARAFCRRGEAHQRCGRILARTRVQPDAAAHLRHRFSLAEGARRVSQAARRGQGARPPQARQRARACSCSTTYAPAIAVLLAARRSSSINTLIEFVRKQYVRLRIREVITPQIFDKALWETQRATGPTIRDNMFMSVRRATRPKTSIDGRNPEALSDVFVRPATRRKRSSSRLEISITCAAARR